MIVIPMLKFVVFLSCGLAAWVKRCRLSVNGLIVPLVLIISISDFVAFPYLNFRTNDLWTSANFTVPVNVEVAADQGFAPMDSQFINGGLVGPDGTIGVIDAAGDIVCGESV